MRTALAICCIACGLAACGGQRPPATPPTPEPAGPGHATVSVTLVDLEGKPVAGVTAIAVTEPNAFTKPVAEGAASGPDGRTTVTIPLSTKLCIRGWDSEMRYFTNNFLDVTAEKGVPLPPMTITMVEGCALDALIRTPDGLPAASVAVELTMEHPTRGPWWPARGVTRADGMFHLRSVPPGRFNLDFKTPDGRTVRRTDVEFQPASRTDLGIVTLQ